MDTEGHWQPRLHEEQVAPPNTAEKEPGLLHEWRGDGSSSRGQTKGDDGQALRA